MTPSKKGGGRKKVRKRNWDERDADSPVFERKRFRGHQEGGETHHLVEVFDDTIEPNAVVISPYGLLAFIQHGGEEHVAHVEDALTNGKTSFLAPGDRVLAEERGGEWFIKAVAPRRSHLSRPAIMKARVQTLAANIDQLVIVTATKQPAFRPGLVDRFLIVAEKGGVRPILCVNKTDLVKAIPEDAAVYRELGIPVFETCCLTGDGIEELRGQLENSVSVLAGHSGVGKSSIIHALDPDHDIATQEVSEATEKGRHTTTASRLYTLQGGIRIIDTPGIRELGLWDITPESLDFYFPEIGETAHGCRFRDCTHTNEPGCAVKEAVETGAISTQRYRSFLRIRESMTTDEREGRPPRNRTAPDDGPLP